MSCLYRNALLSDLDQCHQIELKRYPAEEGACRDNIAKRIQTFPEGFLVAEQKGSVVGFINSGATNKVDLSDEDIKAMIGHEPGGENLVIMSVVVDESAEGKGIAGELMKRYVTQAWESNRKAIFLLCKTHLIPFYEKYGFKWVCKSTSDHGGAEWHEMIADCPKAAISG